MITKNAHDSYLQYLLVRDKDLYVREVEIEELGQIFETREMIKIARDSIDNPSNQAEALMRRLFDQISPTNSKN